MPLPPLWSPSHVLTWTPRAGVVRSWPVRVIATAVAGRPALVAQTLDESRRAAAPAWVRFDDRGAWSWDGRTGYRGEDGVATLDRAGTG